MSMIFLDRADKVEIGDIVTFPINGNYSRNMSVTGEVVEMKNYQLQTEFRINVYPHYADKNGQNTITVNNDTRVSIVRSK